MKETFLLVYVGDKIVFAALTDDIYFAASSLKSLFDVHSSHSVDLFSAVNIDTENEHSAQLHAAFLSQQLFISRF